MFVGVAVRWRDEADTRVASASPEAGTLTGGTSGRPHWDGQAGWGRSCSNEGTTSPEPVPVRLTVTIHDEERRSRRISDGLQNRAENYDNGDSGHSRGRTLPHPMATVGARGTRIVRIRVNP